MTNKPNTFHEKLIVTAEERQAILDDIKRRNRIRQAAKMTILDPETLFNTEVEALVERKYRAFLEPYLQKALAEVQGHPGLAGRLLQTMRIWKQAEAELVEETGIANPNPTPPDIMKVMARYINGSLAQRGVS